MDIGDRDGGGSSSREKCKRRATQKPANLVKNVSSLETNGIRPLVGGQSRGSGRNENNDDRCTAINECFRLERNFRVPFVKKKKKKRFLKRFTFREEEKKKKDRWPAVSVSIFHPPLASLSIFIVTRLEPLSRSFRAPPFDESFRGDNDVSVTELDSVEKDDRAGDGRPPCYASAGWFVTLATHEPRSRVRIMGRSKG